MLVTGVDPDTKAPGLALGDGKRILKVATPRISDGDKHRRTVEEIEHLAQYDQRDLLVVEAQEIYRGSMVNANNQISVATIAGAALAAGGYSKKLHPLPKKWKGQRPKGVDQKATLDHYGWKYRDNGPDKSPTLIETPQDVQIMGEIVDWSEVFDAMGLVLWGSKQP